MRTGAVAFPLARASVLGLIATLVPVALVSAAFPGEGGSLVYVRAGYDTAPVIVIMPKSGNETILTNSVQSPYGDLEPSWSPGGTMIAFVRKTKTGKGEIWRMAADGTSQVRLTSNSADDREPMWSPDGSKIIFSSNRSGNFDIWTMDLDGESPERLTTNSGSDRSPSWSPLGDRILFTSDRGGVRKAWTMNADGTNEAHHYTLEGTGAEVTSVDWRPDGARAIFSVRGFGALARIYEFDTKLWSSSVNGVLEDWDIQEGVYAPGVPGATLDRIVYDSDHGPFGSVMTGILGGYQSVEGPGRDPDMQPIPAFPLVDARFSTFKSDIEWVFNKGITKGCTAERYCPNDAVTREQMAIFLDRALKLPATATDYFSDDTGRTGEAAINRVAAAGITSGCASGKYCPTDKVTRGAMASFLARAFALPATSTDYFTDDNGTTHEANINRVKAAGITSGCTPTTYCPTADVTRGQMAAFLRRALE